MVMLNEIISNGQVYDFSDNNRRIVLVLEIVCKGIVIYEHNKNFLVKFDSGEYKIVSIDDDSWYFE